jgi:hypothetical protein
MVVTASAEMTLGFPQAMNNDVLATRNYDVGASITAAYTDIEQLERNTLINTRSFEPSCRGCSPGTLEASINSNIIGNAHIAWQSVDPQPDSKGHHPIWGRRVEDLTGVFSIQKFIQLWSNSTPGEVSVDWLPCS